MQPCFLLIHLSRPLGHADHIEAEAALRSATLGALSISTMLRRCKTRNPATTTTITARQHTVGVAEQHIPIIRVGRHLATRTPMIATEAPFIHVGMDLAITVARLHTATKKARTTLELDSREMGLINNLLAVAGSAAPQSICISLVDELGVEEACSMSNDRLTSESS